MPLIRPEEMLHGSPLAGWTGRFFHSENMTFALWDISADALPLHEHHHVQEEVWNVVSGAIAITIDGVEHIVDDGSAVTVPSDALHSARPLGARRVVIADYPRRLQLPGVS